MPEARLGEVSDRTRSRFGGRRPWLLLACPLPVASTWLLFQPDLLVSAGDLVRWSCVAHLAWARTANRQGLPVVGFGLVDGYPEANRKYYGSCCRASPRSRRTLRARHRLRDAQGRARRDRARARPAAQ